MARDLTHSCGILLYRHVFDGVEVFLGKSNSPTFWEGERTRQWGIPKGGVETSDASEVETAKREFEEETGQAAPDIVYEKLTDFKTNYGKVLTIFVGDASTQDVKYSGSVMAEREWPLGSGKIVSYPEVSDAQWFPLKEALNIIFYGQRPILLELETALNPVQV